jgi:ATP-dependent helicase/nuclease subunit B
LAAHLNLTSTTNTALGHLISQIRDEKRSNVLIPITILVPTSGIMHELRSRLGDTMGVQLYQFYGLGNAVLDEAGIPIHEINDTAIRRLIKNILGEMKEEGKLTTFSPVMEKPGFAEVVLDWVREMKSQGIFPEQYTAYAQANGNDQDLQLAELYTRYQTFMLDRNYSDADGLLWITAEALEKNQHLFQTDGPLYIIGFDQFTPVQIRILGQLAERFRALNLYLLWDDRRSEDSIVLSRLKRTRDSLLASIPFDVSILQDAQVPCELLGHIHTNIFEPSEAIPGDNHSIQLIEAPSREAEVRRALQRVKCLLIEGVSVADIAILTPNRNAYLPIIRTVATEYGIPIECERPLLGNPLIAALANLLMLPENFSWHETFMALRSPYIQQSWLSAEQIELLDLLSRERPVVAGRDQWQFAVRPLDIDTADREDDDLGRPPLVATLPSEKLTGIHDGLMAFFDHLTPPNTATYREYIWWIQTAIIGYLPEEANDEENISEAMPSLDLLESCQQGLFCDRDMEALGMLMRALRRLLASAETVPTETEVTWETFRDDIMGLLRVMLIPPDPLQASVRFGRLDEGRARIVDYLFVLGLSEGEFPTPPPADPLYAPIERESHPLPLMRFSPADDASLWWQVIGNVRKRLVILRPYIDNNGAPWQPSPYWDAVQACVTDLNPEQIPIAEHPKLKNSASAGELLIALAQIGAQEIPEKFIIEWDYTHHAEGIIRQRQSYQPLGPYEGVLVSPLLRDELAERYGDDYVWSASRLNRYANCPFGFFVENLLKLKARHDPEDGLDALQRGSLLHAILEKLYKRLGDDGTTPTSSNLDIILRYLDESCAEIFSSAPARYGFRPGALWEYEKEELHRLIRGLVSWECEQNEPTARFLPWLQEVGFGIGRGDRSPLEVLGEHAQFRLRGVIDRLDRNSAGNLRVIDYKSGSTQNTRSDLKQGLALQTALYALAAEHFWLQDQGRVAESHYWHIPSRKPSGSLDFQETVREDRVAETIIQRAAQSVERIRVGIFPSAPAKPGQGSRSCRSRCDFGSVCRVSRQSIFKAKRGELE